MELCGPCSCPGGLVGSCCTEGGLFRSPRSRSMSRDAQPNRLRIAAALRLGVGDISGASA